METESTTFHGSTPFFTLVPGTKNVLPVPHNPTDLINSNSESFNIESDSSTIETIPYDTYDDNLSLVLKNLLVPEYVKITFKLY